METRGQDVVRGTLNKRQVVAKCAKIEVNGDQMQCMRKAFGGVYHRTGPASSSYSLVFFTRASIDAVLLFGVAHYTHILQLGRKLEGYY